MKGQNDPEIPEFDACSCPINDEVDGFKEGVDYFPDKASPANLQFWRIEYRLSYKVTHFTKLVSVRKLLIDFESLYHRSLRT